MADWRWVIVILIKRSLIPPNSWFPSSSEFFFSFPPVISKKSRINKKNQVKRWIHSFFLFFSFFLRWRKRFKFSLLSSPFGIKSCTVSGTSLTSTQAFILSSCRAFDWFPFRSRDSEFFFIFSSGNSLPVGDSLLFSFQTCDASYSPVL